jgi:hypothetical protein
MCTGVSACVFVDAIHFFGEIATVAYWSREAAMSEWSNWYRVVKQTGGGRKYLYLQRVRRVPGRKSPQTQSRSLGRINGEGGGSGLALAIFGLEDEYGERRDSLWNRTVNKEAKAATPEPVQEKAPDVAEGSEESAGAGNGEEVSE